MQKKIENRAIPNWVFFIVIFTATMISFSILDTQFSGDDEALTLFTSNRVAQHLAEGRLDFVWQVLQGDYHPPGRNLITAPFIWLFGATNIALRFPNILVWIASAVVATFIGNYLGGLWIGLFSGILLGGSGLFSLQAMGHGHGIFTFWILVLIYNTLKNPSFRLTKYREYCSYIMGGIYCIFAFLWFTSAIAVAFPYHGLYAYCAIREKSRKVVVLKRYLFLTLPFIFFYISYYWYFFGIHAYRYYSEIIDAPVGQFNQNLVRASKARLNIESFVANIYCINGLFLPILSEAILILGMILLYRYYKKIFILLFPYVLVWSFYITGNTGQHFLAYFSWILPFGVLAIARLLSSVRLHPILGLSLLSVLVVGWSVGIHVVRYSEANYPSKILNMTYSGILWTNNVVKPYNPIARDLHKNLGAEERFLSYIGSAFSGYHFQDERFLSNPKIETKETPEGNCWLPLLNDEEGNTIKAAVTTKNQVFCPEVVDRIIEYPDSQLQVIIFQTN